MKSDKQKDKMIELLSCHLSAVYEQHGVEAIPMYEYMDEADFEALSFESGFQDSYPDAPIQLLHEATKTALTEIDDIYHIGYERARLHAIECEAEDAIHG